MMTARALAVMHTCMYDAWAAYDDVADGVHWPTSLRQPRRERNTINKVEAISFAAHRALVDQFPSQSGQFDTLLTALGHQAPGHAGTLGRAACEEVLTVRHADGANQLGDRTPLNPVPYADYTGYVPVNTVDILNDPNHWQPLATPSGAPQQFLTPQWGGVRPFAITSLDDLRPEPPPSYPDRAYVEESNQLIRFSARLDDRKKMIAEYWADGPSTETPPGHWNLFAQEISRRDRHSLDDDVKMFFALGNALLDASIAAWDCKVAYDFVRPITAIQFLYAGKQVRAWAGPGLGTQSIDGSQFRTYIQTPAFAEYVSGHSTFSAASAYVLAQFTGSDRFGLSVTLAPGSSVIEPGLTPAEPVTLSWKKFSDAADEAGLSRRLGGIHFWSGDHAGRLLGRRVGRLAWKRSAELFEGHGRNR